ncbi:DUF2793 domain-containing protein [Erythrobacter mangrovi]|uniref:DUF2793 domain-containing protein n=1 Tax=Erythrobacter mangrovi TaxID=2739433 RepID=A0A7D4BAJ5_9SPHN|nr:DUF2793 domain-containing protein [Erythrobacter mangrovi]
MVGTSASPPAAPSAGDCWIVAAGAVGEWSGRDDCLAWWDGDQWTFAPPFRGLRAFDQAQDRYRTFSDSWDAAPIPTDPSGGSVVDVEARDIIATILAILRAHRIIPGA